MAATLVAQITDQLASRLDITSSALDPIVGQAKASPKQPDIAYHPDETKWKARTARRLAEEPSLPQTPLPAGFPKKLESPLVWEAKDWTNASQWEYVLNQDQLKEIDEAVKHSLRR
ncbi:hypothetical protein CVT26_011955 [Gymnopilus dilepis]|uniref:Uncharacterized protein n=1 Tax=Gymnopilus dilepis TaxID=231916 RepID=A0A409VYF5_9AGAR|nr:hypothetical protein CVT26_011955 [Gymnopilus dilepis]